MDFCEGKGDISLWNEVCKDSCVMSWCHLVFYIIQISWDEPPTISMKWGLERCCVMSWCHLVFSIIEILWGEWGYISMKWGLCEDWCDVVMPLSFLYNWNSVRLTTNYLYLVPFPTMMSTSSLYTHPLRFRSYSNSMRFIYICSMLESISAMKTLSTLHLQSSSIRRENHQSRSCIYLLWKKKVWKKEMRRSRTREGMRVLLYNRRSDWWRCV